MQLLFQLAQSLAGSAPVRNVDMVLIYSSVVSLSLSFLRDGSAASEFKYYVITSSHPLLLENCTTTTITSHLFGSNRRLIQKQRKSSIVQPLAFDSSRRSALGIAHYYWWPLCAAVVIWFALAFIVECNQKKSAMIR